MNRVFTLLRQGLHRFENGVMVALFAAIILLPLLEALARATGWFQIDGTAGYTKHLVLWLAFLGGLLATRERRQLRLSTAEFLPARARVVVDIITAAFSLGVCLVLAWASWQVVQANREEGGKLAIGLPTWISELVMPAALVAIGLRMAWQAGPRWWQRLLALGAGGAILLLDKAPEFVEHNVWPLTGFVVVCAALGAPVFIAMAGLGMLLYFSDGTSVSAVSAEVYRLVASPTLPAIPLLTACGYLLAETKAAERLVRFFRAMFGWMPGGVAVLVVAVCAMFTTFTGGSGVTIIALGGLVYGILREDGYPEAFSQGLVTSASSLGLLFPPSLPIIVYSVVVSANPDLSAPADELYIAGLVPGLLMLVGVALYGVIVGGRRQDRGSARRQAFSFKELLAAGWGAKWELSVPVLVLVVFLSGWASLVEAAAAAAFYALIIEVFITRDIHPTRDLPGILAKTGVLVGAVLILLAAAMGLSSYVLVEAELPDKLLTWVQGHIEQPWIFLLALNLLLIVVGCLLEIYSAIVILPPILAPIALHYGVDPVHLGIIFLANLELGFITPPVGLNLFLAGSRFNVPMVKLFRPVVPYILIMLASVLVVTYVPALTTGVVKLVKGEEASKPAEPLEDF
jgi:C4-dicarboxylate transporter DctM subunit